MSLPRPAALLAVLVFAALTSGEARAESIAVDAGARSDDAEQRPVTFLWLPGAARVVPHALSASRDNGLVAISLSPYVSATAGGDLAMFALRFPQTTLRVGFFGLMELEGSDPIESNADGFGGMFPADAVILWRGQYGTSLGVSLDRLAELWLPPGGLLEVVLSFRHESEHFTGSAEESGERWQGVHDIGNFLMYEVAARLPLRRVDLELRLQLKLFLPRDGRYSYTYGPGLDVIARWRLAERFQPFISFFFEYLFGGDQHAGRDNYLARSLLGALFPGRVGDVQLFLSIAAGHGKGKLALHEAFLLGAGFRVSWPAEERRAAD